MQQAKRRLSWPKRIVFNLLLLTIVYLVIEVFAYFLIITQFGQWQVLASQRHTIAIQNPFHPTRRINTPLMLHPYIGVVRQPLDDAATSTEKFRIREYGFIDDDLPIHQRTGDQVIVAILGGSVAYQFSTSSTNALAEELSKSPEFAGRRFKFVRLATSGYKQPQQLMTLMYMLSLGAEFDVVINLDGFNEAALPGIDNIPNNVFFAYPRDWGTVVAFNRDPEFQRMTGYISYLRECQRDVTRWADAIPFAYSPTVQFIWNVWNLRLELRIISVSTSMSHLAQKSLTFCSSGPPRSYQSQDEMYRDCIDLWLRTSLLLHRVCESNRIRYFHFLQPNQHLEGSKPISGAEIGMTSSTDNGNSEAVKACYPIMRVESSNLTANGVAFFDLTQVFADHPERIYVDTCCHVNSHGNLIMAKAMGERICEYISRTQ